MIFFILRLQALPVMYFFLNQVILVKESITLLEERLPSKNFVRLHRSFIINAQKFCGISKEIELNNAKNYQLEDPIVTK
jgi:DNA-binding LytR/AlgR family response regulator